MVKLFPDVLSRRCNPSLSPHFSQTQARTADRETVEGETDLSLPLSLLLAWAGSGGSTVAVALTDGRTLNGHATDVYCYTGRGTCACVCPFRAHVAN